VGEYATLLQSDTVQEYGHTIVGTSPVGVGLRKNPKDLSASEREESGDGKGVGVYATLLQSDTVQEYGRTKTVTSPVGVGIRKNPKDLTHLSTSERGEGHRV
jgi:hypothetical protein